MDNKRHKNILPKNTQSIQKQNNTYKYVLKQAKRSYHKIIIDKSENLTIISWKIIKHETNANSSTPKNTELISSDIRMYKEPHAVDEICNYTGQKIRGVKRK